MNSEQLALFLCFLGIISIFVFPRFTRWWYKRQLQEKRGITTDSEYINAEKKKYAVPLNLTVWSYRIGGILIIGIAAYIYFSGFLD